MVQELGEKAPEPGTPRDLLYWKLLRACKVMENDLGCYSRLPEGHVCKSHQWLIDRMRTQREAMKNESKWTEMMGYTRRSGASATGSKARSKSRGRSEAPQTCRLFLKGTCRNGQDCKFSHNPPKGGKGGKASRVRSSGTIYVATGSSCPPDSWGWPESQEIMVAASGHGGKGGQDGKRRRILSRRPQGPEGSQRGMDREGARSPDPDLRLPRRAGEEQDPLVALHPEGVH